MKFGEAEARRVLSFCLSKEFEAKLSQEDDRCAITIVPVRSAGEVPLRFEALSFEEALRHAAGAGAVRETCVERQIAFIQSFRGKPPDPSSRGPSLPMHAEPEAPRPPDRRRLSLGHYRALAEIRYQMRRFVSFSEKAARAAGLEPAQHQLLLAIKGLPPHKRPNVQTLAERMVMDVGACEALGESLIAKGYLRITAHEDDRRDVLWALTSPARAVIKSLTSLHRNQMLSVGPAFVSSLGSILSSMEDEADAED